MKYLFIIALVSLSSIGCKVEAVPPAQYPQSQAPAPTAQKESPTFTQCAEAGWVKSKEWAGAAYDYASSAYEEYKKNHPDNSDKASSEP